MCEKRVLRGILGRKRQKVTGMFKKLHFENTARLESSPKISTVIKSYNRRWAGHVLLLGEKGNVKR